MVNLSHQRRHGDVFLHPVDSIPDGTPVTHKGEYILALGEATGHAHRLRVKTPENLKVMSHQGSVYFCLLEVGTLTHEEHGTLEIQPGLYRQGMEREYSYADEAMRSVQD